MEFRCFINNFLYLSLIIFFQQAFGFKEDYMIPIFKKFTDPQHMEDIKTFLDIISSLTRMHSTNIEAPIILKEG